MTARFLPYLEYEQPCGVIMGLLYLSKTAQPSAS